ncbi:MAG TPA: UDP-N-acetylglucosamine 2-epimerase (non-hydrolyzing), partial [Armatimonadetes bacterium]|nr:UDP-N-acetylglucosamine 2-epimerase (non-hydrolyzing) [Armatimonadota bacterium]
MVQRHVMLVAGARPNFMKIAPIWEAMHAYPELCACVVHTGQHYDYEMSQVFFQDLRLPKPDIYLDVGSGTHAVQTARIMERFEKALMEHHPDIVVVVGDVNSTLACSITAVKLQVPVAHVEAGIRSFDRTMPEEINRVATDAVSDILFPPTQFGYDNLIREGKSPEQIFLVGDVMIDTLLRFLPIAKQRPTLSELGVTPNGYALMTLHRPHNVDHPAPLERILNAVEAIQRDIPIVFPIHPRTVRRLKEFGLKERLNTMPNVIQLDPIGYLDFINLMAHARFLLTDSGGIQEETTVLGIPCLTMRENTERPETIEMGTNTLVGND